MIGIRPLLPVFLLIVIGFALLFALGLIVILKPLRNRNYVRRILILALVFTIFLRPVIYGAEVGRVVNNLNLYFVVDNSGSMATKDMDSGERYRFQAVAKDIKEIVDAFPGAKYSIISLDYDVYQILPMTSSADATKNATDTIYPRYNIATSGSELKELLEYANKRAHSYNLDNPDRHSLVFIMSDGEDTFENETSVPEGLASEVSGGAVIGYGTTEGDFVRRANEKGELSGYVKESGAEGGYHRSVINENNLKHIADLSGLKYIRRDDIGNLSKNPSDYLNVTQNVVREGMTDGFFDLYWIIALLIFALLLWELADIGNKLLRERKAVK